MKKIIDFLKNISVAQLVLILSILILVISGCSRFINIIYGFL